MASVSLHPLISFFFLSRILFCLCEITELPPSVLLPVTKDGKTGQYLTQTYYGESTEPTKLVLDLGGPFLWLDCGSSRPSPVHCRSIQCSSARLQPCLAADSALASPQESPCSILLQNPLTGAETAGELVEDALAVESPSPTAVVGQFLFSCSPSFLLRGLATGVRGVLGLGKTRIGVPTQISLSFGYSQKFSLCLSSTNGMFYSGQNQSNLDNSEITKSLIYTPLLPGDEYYINLKAIKIQNKKLSLGLPHQLLQVMKISTVTPYSKMETQAYNVFLRAFAMAAESLNMTRVSAVAPFEACYFVGASPLVPVVDLVLQSEMVKWRIYGHNSMVKVKEDLMCLGFLDGGSNLEASIVLGGHQLEDNLLEFDLGSSMLGFSSSLIMKQISCSQMSSSAADKVVQTL